MLYVPRLVLTLFKEFADMLRARVGSKWIKDDSPTGKGLKWRLTSSWEKNPISLFTNGALEFAPGLHSMPVTDEFVTPAALMQQPMHRIVRVTIRYGTDDSGRI